MGIDMAAQPKGTAACLISWDRSSATVEFQGPPLLDSALHGLVGNPDYAKVGLDVPFGWPVDFVNTVQLHAKGEAVAVVDPRQLSHRATDRCLGMAHERWPLSVSADRIAHVTFRALPLLAGVDRTGGGRLIEVYPALALRRWGLMPPVSSANSTPRLPVPSGSWTTCRGPSRRSG